MGPATHRWMLGNTIREEEEEEEEDGRGGGGGVSQSALCRFHVPAFLQRSAGQVELERPSCNWTPGRRRKQLFSRLR